MPINFEKEIKKNAVNKVAEDMLMAAKTAPKARGVDRLFLAVLTKDEVKEISTEMIKIAKNNGPDFFERDANNIINADACIILGSKYGTQDLQLCGYCGFENCKKKNKNPQVPCVFNIGDLGIAIGSAVSIAMDRRVDNRIMYSAGYTALKIGIIPDDVKIAYVIPLSVSSKNPFFDRIPDRK